MLKRIISMLFGHDDTVHLQETADCQRFGPVDPNNKSSECQTANVIAEGASTSGLQTSSTGPAFTKSASTNSASTKAESAKFEPTKSAPAHGVAGHDLTIEQRAVSSYLSVRAADRARHSYLERNSGFAGRKSTNDANMDPFADDETRRLLNALTAANNRLSNAATQGSIASKIAIANDEQVSPTILSLLANDSQPDVRYSVAENCNTPESTLYALMSDDVQYVAQRATQTWRRQARMRAELMNATRIINETLFPLEEMKQYADDVFTSETPKIFGAVPTFNDDTSLDSAADESSSQRSSDASLLERYVQQLTSAIEFANNSFSAAISTEQDLVPKSTSQLGQGGIAAQADAETELENAAIPWLLQLAEGQSTNLSVLISLSFHSDADVKIAVAENPHAPIELLQKLAMDEDPDVRFAMAENHNIDSSILERLADDSNPYVANRAQKTLLRLRKRQTLQTDFSRNNDGINRRRASQ